ncbi:hypothetical protein [Aurantimonas endophytica]|uniref:PepSY domain-containing protein n=1 Tax=Aurantimonas endophytica TaxID=1522175 RepID=A0A7W6HBM5_9HYPH|nr:hypothetical protein [Aurantimonas endophytica]MBB4002245.1 hypothetical protein [Aurantimonas endophytica]MCO6402129.1 hypothetical protein [Aurantimonas endophytica]
MRQVTMMGAAAALAALSLDAAAQAPTGQCVPALTEAGFELTLRVEGQDGTYRLTCRDGSLVAVAADAGSAGDGSADARIADSAAEAAAALDGAEALGEPPADLTGPAGTRDEADGAGDAGDRETGVNAAGVAGQTPEVSMSQAVREPAAAGGPAMAADGRAGEAAARKPAIAETDAAASGESHADGEPKHEERLGDAAGNFADDDMIAVPLVVIGNAELALPGARFDSVAIEGDGEFFDLRGTLRGDAVSVAVAPDGVIMQIDRMIEAEAVPEGVARIADALLPEAEIETITLSSRHNYTSFFVYEGRDVRGTPFTLEIRSDGRNVEFKRPA